MKVYICDDSKTDLIKIVHYMKKYLADNKVEENHIDCKIETFGSATELLKEFDNTEEKPILIITDILMTDVDGMEAAKHIRAKGENTSIIFATSSAEHAMEAFQVYADGYLHKPYSYVDLKGALKRVEDKLFTKKKTITVRADRMDIEVTLDDICYAEVYDHTVLLFMGQNDIRLTMSMEELKTVLQDEESFVACGRSYLINMNQIREMYTDNIVMKNGQEIMIPVRIRKQMKEIYKKYCI